MGSRQTPRCRAQTAEMALLRRRMALKLQQPPRARMLRRPRQQLRTERRPPALQAHYQAVHFGLAAGRWGLGLDHASQGQEEDNACEK